MKVSVVIPCYRSEATIAKVVTLTREELVGAGYDYEFILVNDCSPDATFAQIQALCEADDHVVGIDCAKNLGQHCALMAGMRYTTGDAVLLMDDDMQTHPSQCLKLIRALDEKDADVVFARWDEHKEALWRRAGSAFASWSMRVMTNRPKDVYSSNYLVMRRHIRDEVIRYTGPYPYVQGLLFRATSRTANVDVQHFEREEGTSGYTFKTLVRLWANVLGFSLFPLRAASVAGILLGGIGIVFALVVVIRKIVNPSIPAGWSSLFAALLSCSGLILLSLGVVGEYLGRVFMTINNAPQFVPRSITDNRRPQAADVDGTNRPHLGSEVSNGT